METHRKRKKIVQKLSSLGLAFAMVATSLPSMMKEVHAAGELDKTQFATVEDLKGFNTAFPDSSTKVYFGVDENGKPLEWWIAGSQQDKGLTLFANMALRSEVMSPDEENKMYNDKTVQPNHYGASEARKTLQTLESTNFSYFEHDKMIPSKIYTEDMMDNSIYETYDNLYLPYGQFGDSYVTVGQNSKNNLNQGLIVDNSYWNGMSFWLRTPTTSHKHTLFTMNGSSISSYIVTGTIPLTPAFELNLSDVLFASSIPAVTKDGELKEADAMTLRYSDPVMGEVAISMDKTRIKLKDVPDNAYLVIQDENGAEAVSAANKSTVFASSMGLDSFEGCKVWIETYYENERIAYAKLATQEQGVAEVDGVLYSSLQEAIEKCPKGETVKLLEDVSITYTQPSLRFNQDCTLDLNNHILTLEEYTYMFINNACSVTIITGDKGNIVSNNSSRIGIENYYDCFLTVIGSLDCPVSNSATILGGNFTGEVINAGSGIIEDGTFANVYNNGTIKGGTFDYIKGSYGDIEGGYFNDVSGLSDYTTITGGYFKEKPNLDLPEGYIWMESQNKDYPHKVIPEENLKKLNISLGNTMTLVSGQLQQTIEKGKEIQPITIKSSEGYEFTDAYLMELEGLLKGLSVKMENDTLTISGVLAEDLTVVIPDASKIIPPHIEHIFTDWQITKEATCETAGQEVRECKECDYKETREVKALGHSLGEWKVIKEATLTQDGEKVRECTRCEYVEKAIIPMLTDTDDKDDNQNTPDENEGQVTNPNNPNENTTDKDNDSQDNGVNQDDTNVVDKDKDDKETEKDNNVVPTGDNAPVGIMFGALAISGIVGVILYRRKKEK